MISVWPQRRAPAGAISGQQARIITVDLYRVLKMVEIHNHLSRVRRGQVRQLRCARARGGAGRGRAG
jgi:hypothetical protein